MIYAFWFVHILFGSFVDARLWHDKDKDPVWLKDWFDIFWLGWFAFVPFVAAYVGLDMLTFKSVLIAFGMSIIWDLVYSKIEHGEWIVALPLWFILPNPFGERIVIGFDTVKKMVIFNIVRIAVLILTLFM